MANDILTPTISVATFTITLASLATATGRQSTMITNSGNYPAALVMLRIESGTGGTLGTTYDVYLLRGDGVTTYRTDGAGATDAAITIENAPSLGSVRVTNSTNKFFYIDCDTAPLGPLGPEWGIAVVNSTGQALNATEGNHIKEYLYYRPQIQ